MFDSGWEDGPGRAPTWSRATPGAELVAALESCEPVGLVADDGFDASERLAAWESVAAWAMARQSREAARYLEARQARVRRCSRDLDDERSSVAMELAAHYRLAPRTGEHRLAQAVALVERLPRTLAAMENGRISFSHARVMIDQTEACTDETARAVDAALWDRPERERTPTQLRETVRRIIARLDPEHLRRRAVKARLERAVRYWADDDGATGVIQVRMPAPEARGVYAVIDAFARSAGAEPDGEARTVANTRADVLRDIVLDAAESRGAAERRGAAGQEDPATADPAPDPVADAGIGPVLRPVHAPVAGPDPARASCDCPVPTGPPLRIQVRVTIPWMTAAGLSEQPGDLEGHGPLPADQARAMAFGADTSWQRLLTDPMTGTVEHLDLRRYRPPRRLAEFVRSRHHTCAAPGCRVPAARCDLDHVVAFDHSDPNGDGGPGRTAAHNLCPGCRRHHRIKTHTGWTCESVPDPAGARAPALRWTAPSGRSWLVRAPEIDPVPWRTDLPARTVVRPAA